MIDLLLASGTLNLTYTIVLGISFIFAIISLLGAELGDALDFDTDLDSDGFDVINVSPFALASFGAIFGITGLITRIAFEMNPFPSLLWATGAGLIVGGAAQAFFVYVLSATKSSHFSLQADGVGRSADVILTIPGDGKGTIAYDNVSGRVTLGARSLTGEQIRTGESVVIEKIVGRVAYVRPEPAAR
jgi:hypothetical protein